MTTVVAFGHLSVLDGYCCSGVISSGSILLDEVGPFLIQYIVYSSISIPSWRGDVVVFKGIQRYGKPLPKSSSTPL